MWAAPARAAPVRAAPVRAAPVTEDVLESPERSALREASPLRLRNTVPRKMATVTPNTPKFPQKAGLQPAVSSGAVIKNALRSDTIPLQPGTSLQDESATAERYIGIWLPI